MKQNALILKIPNFEFSSSKGENIEHEFENNALVAKKTNKLKKDEWFKRNIGVKDNCIVIESHILFKTIMNAMLLHKSPMENLVKITYPLIRDFSIVFPLLQVYNTLGSKFLILTQPLIIIRRK